MAFFSNLDLLALAWFFAAWLGYALMIELTPHGKNGLNGLMHRYRDLWMQRMLARDARMMDGQVIYALQNGTAFFASTSLIALGGAVTLFHANADMLSIVAALPFGQAVTPIQWEIKVVGLMIIFVYAFFKFAWSYRLFNYVAILLGATPPPAEKGTPEAEAHVKRTARLFAAAGRHFNHGQRSFFFALGYLGWFVSPWVFMASTAAVVVVMWWRQFGSDASHAMDS